MNSVFIHILVFLAFLFNSFGIMPVQAVETHSYASLPIPGVRVHLSPAYNPSVLKGIKVHPENPFKFDFIMDVGAGLAPAQNTRATARVAPTDIKSESQKLIKYFLASLTIPEKDLWVNLSPYEKNRIVPDAFGQTEMGRDLLAQDYMLKQITASLIYPEDEMGKKFWRRVYEEAAKRFGTTNIPVNTFNKVWIVPEKAVVYENAKAGTAYVVDSKLKVMLEEDYLSLTKNTVGAGLAPAQNNNDVRATARVAPANINQLGSQIVREVVIPALTKEINQGQNFAQLRQVYNSLILATWYKKKIKDSILIQVYANKNKIKGIEFTNSIQTLLPTRGHVQDRTTRNVSPSSLPSKEALNLKATQRNQPNDVEAIYQQYLQAFKKGVFNYIKEEPLHDQGLQQSKKQGIFPRKYFSGGMKLDFAMHSMEYTQAVPDLKGTADHAMLFAVNVTADRSSIDAAMADSKGFAGWLPEESPLFSKQEIADALQEDQYAPQNFINAFKKDPFLKNQFENLLADNFNSLNETVESHTLDVFSQFEKYFVQIPMDGILTHRFMRLLLVLHDIGKWKAIQEGGRHLQHKYTMAIFEWLKEGLPITEFEYRIMYELLDHDYAGDLLEFMNANPGLEVSDQRMIQKVGEAELKIKGSVARINQGEQKISLQEFWRVFIRYQQADSTSYRRWDHQYVKNEASGDFIMNQERGRLLMESRIESVYGLLEGKILDDNAAMLGLKDQAMRIDPNNTYDQSEWRPESRGSLVLSDNYRERFLPLVNPKHALISLPLPNVSLVAFVPSEVITQSEGFQKIKQAILQSKLLKSKVSFSNEKLIHFTFKGGVSSDALEGLRSQLSNANSFRVRIKGITIANYIRGRVYFKVYPEFDVILGKNGAQKIIDRINAPFYGAHPAGFLQLTDDLNQEETAELLKIIEQFNDEKIADFQVNELVLGSHKNDLLGGWSEIGKIELKLPNKTFAVVSQRIREFSFNGSVRKKVLEIEDHFNKLARQLSINSQHIETERAQRALGQGDFSKRIVLEEIQDKGKTIKVGKLVRDRLPGILRRQNKSARTHIAKRAEYRILLVVKLQEELGYLKKVLGEQDSTAKQNKLIHELAALKEVIESIKKEAGVRVGPINNSNTGGIDLTNSQMDKIMQTKGNSNIQFHFDPAQVALWQRAQGVSFEITNYQPMTDLAKFLGG